jgi:hypothetical protein
MQLPISEFDRYDAVSEGMVTITNAISYSDHLEDLYLDKPSLVMIEFREAITNTYGNVLKFLSTAMGFYSKYGFSAYKP